jgi:hypothetical protein
MTDTIEPADKPAVINPVPSKPAAPPERLDEVVKIVQMEVVSGHHATRFERGAGSNPYNKGGRRDVWGQRRRA